MIKAAIFDMDGLLIDSEPYWQKAEIDIFQKVNIKLTSEMCMETMGLRIDEVVRHWYEKHPWKEISQKEIIEEIISSVINYIQAEAGPMDGVYETLESIKMKGLKIALASSSHFKIIDSVITKLNIKSYFEFVHSAEKEEYGKPHPAIFLSTAKMLGVAPVECMVFEDSFNGLIAAKAARMKTIAIPDPIHFSHTKFDFSNIKIKSLRDFNDEHFNLLCRATT